LNNLLDLDPDDYMLGLERRNEKLVKRLRRVEASLQASQRRNGILVEGLLQNTKQASTSTTSTTVPVEPPDWAVGAGLVPRYWEKVEIERHERRNEQIESTALKSAKESGPAWKTNMDDLFERGGEPNHIAVYSGGG